MQDVINTAENKQLLYKYLQKYLIEEKNISEQQAKQKAVNAILKLYHIPVKK